MLASFVVLVGCPRRQDGALPFGATNADCASCHDEHGAELAGSAHGRATESPVLAALLPRVEAAWGADARAACVSCHAPEHAPDAEPEISCVSCHAAVGNRGTGDGALVIDLGAPLDGPITDAEPTPAHASRARGFVSDDTLCLTCHDTSGPGLFVEHAAAEHAVAVERVGAPTCLTCHLPAREPGPVAAGALLDRPRRSHTFVGPTPPTSRDETSLAAWTESLRDLFGHDRVLLAVERDGDDAVVTLENAGLGHDLPTGVTFLRELRVDLVLVHADGTTEVMPGVIVLGDLAMAGDAAVALPTDADRIEPRRLPPGEATSVRVAITDVTALRARLVLRAYRAELLDALRVPLEVAPEVVVLETPP